MDLFAEFNTHLLHFRIRQEPDQRFVVKIDNLDTISPWIAKIATERWLQFEFVFLSQFLFDFFELRFVANHDPEMPHVCSLNLVHFKYREELMLPQFEERITLASTHLFEIENVLVKG